MLVAFSRARKSYVEGGILNNVQAYHGLKSLTLAACYADGRGIIYTNSSSRGVHQRYMTSYMRHHNTIVGAVERRHKLYWRIPVVVFFCHFSILFVADSPLRMHNLALHYGSNSDPWAVRYLLRDMFACRPH